MAVRLVKPKNFKNREVITEKNFNEIMSDLGVDSNFAIAVSGGPDSLALMHLGKNYSKEMNINFSMLSIDHNIRKESSKEIEWIKKIAKKNKIEFFSKKIKKYIGKSNTLALARVYRYEELSNICKKKDLRFLLTAHHLDDEIENFLMRLVRGSGIKGLSSLRYKSKYKNTGLMLVRPLLGFSKKTLIKYLSTKGQAYIFDKTNVDNKYDRTRIRNLCEKLIKEGLDKKRFKNVVSNLKNADEAINVSVKEYLLKYVKFDKTKNIYFKLNKFLSLPEEIQHRVLTKLLRLIGNKNKKPRSKSISLLIKSFVLKKNTSSSLNECLLLIKDGLIYIKPATKSFRNELNIISSVSRNWTDMIDHY